MNAQNADSTAEAVVKFRVQLGESITVNESLYLSGNHRELGNWNPQGLQLKRSDDGNYYEGSIAVARSTVLQFKVTRGNWQTVEKDSQGRDRPNRVQTVDKDTTIDVVVEGWANASETDMKVRSVQRPSTIAGTLEVWQESSLCLERGQILSGEAKEPLKESSRDRLADTASNPLSRTIRVWLPPHYGQPNQDGAPKRFPVLYMLDGQNLFDQATAAFGVEWEIDETLTQGIRDGQLPEMIVVGIDNSANRIEEYTFHRFEFAGRQRGGESNQFLRWLTEILKPQIDQKYNTDADRRSTWIGGSSLGGLCALHAVLEHNDTFSVGLVLSPSLTWNEERLVKDTKTQLSQIRLPTTLWFDFGDSETSDTTNARVGVERFARFRDAALSVTEAMPGNVVRLSFSIVPGGSHNESSWRQRFPIAIKTLFGTQSSGGEGD